MKRFTGQKKLTEGNIAAVTSEAALWQYEKNTDTAQLNITLNTKLQIRNKGSAGNAWRLILSQDCQFPDKIPAIFRGISKYYLFIYLFIPLYLAEPLTMLCEGSTERWLRNTAADKRLDSTGPWEDTSDPSQVIIIINPLAPELFF